MRKPLSTKKMSTPSEPPFGNNDPKNRLRVDPEHQHEVRDLVGRAAGQPGEVTRRT